MFQPIYHVSVSPTDGIGPTQGQRKTLSRVGIEPTTFEFDHSFGYVDTNCLMVEGVCREISSSVPRFRTQ